MIKSDRGRALEEGLKALGKWGEYEAMVDKFKREGLRGTNAHQNARKYYVEHYPQLATIGGVLPAWAKLRKKDFANKPKISHKETVDWAIENVAFKDVQPVDAPNAKAWLYVQRMREDTDFLHDILKKRVPSLSKAQQTEGMNDDGRTNFKLIQKLEDEAKARNANSVLSSGQEKVAI